MPGPAFTTGDQLSLHPIEEEDHEFVQYGRNHPEVRASLLAPTIQTSDDVAEMLDDSDFRFLVCRADDEDPEPVGVVAFARVPESMRIGWLMYWVAPEHQGSGYVSEGASLFLDYAFRERGFHKVDPRWTPPTPRPPPYWRNPGSSARVRVARRTSWTATGETRTRTDCSPPSGWTVGRSGRYKRAVRLDPVAGWRLEGLPFVASCYRFHG